MLIASVSAHFVTFIGSFRGVFEMFSLWNSKFSLIRISNADLETDIYF